MNEMRLFDPVTAKAVTDEAVERAGAHADGDWMAAALGAVESCARGRSLFTTDDVYEYLTDASTHEPRAMGAVMRKAQAAGICQATEYYRPSSRPQAHQNPKRVWQSLRFGS
jgi:hypothetical protein